MKHVALVAVQLEIGDQVLASADAYRNHLVTAATDAVAAAGRADFRLVVMPEIAGHLALYALAPAVARRAKTLGGALAASAVRRPLDVLRGVATSRLLDARHAVLAALAPDGERFWKSVFGPLARRLEAYIVAGSHLRLGADGALANASLLFGPDGRLLATTDKVNLVPGIEDGARGALALTRGDATVPIVHAPFGRIATLIGYDGFREPHTKTERFVPMCSRLAARSGVDIVANPAANPWPWLAPWQLNEAYPSREAQWHTEGLRGSLVEAPAARHGITAQLVGKLLDLAFEGRSEIIERDDRGVRTVAHADHYNRGGHVTALVSWYA